MKTLKLPIFKIVNVFVTMCFLFTSTNVGLIFAEGPTPTQTNENKTMPAAVVNQTIQQNVVDTKNAIESPQNKLESSAPAAPVIPDPVSLLTSAPLNTEPARQNAVSDCQDTFKNPPPVGTYTKTTSTSTQTKVYTYLTAADKTNGLYDTVTIYNKSDGAIVSKTGYRYDILNTRKTDYVFNYDTATGAVKNLTVYSYFNDSGYTDRTVAYTASTGLFAVKEYENATTKRQIGDATYRSSADLASFAAVSKTGYYYTQAGTKKTAYALVYNADGSATTSEKYYTYYADGYTEYYYYITNNSTPKKLYLYRDQSVSSYKEYYEYRWDASTTCQKAVYYCSVNDANGAPINKTKQSLTYDSTGTIVVSQYDYTYFGEDTANYPGNTFTSTMTYITRDVVTGNVTKNEVTDYYSSNGFAKSKHTVTYDASTKAVTANTKYEYSETVSGRYTTYTVYKKDATDTISTKTSYCYVKNASGVDQRKTSQSLTYNTAGTIITSEYDYTYFGDNKNPGDADYGNLYTATKTYITKSGTTGKITKNEVTEYYSSNGYAKSLHTVTYNATTGAVTKNEKYGYYEAVSGRKASYATYKLDTTDTMLTKVSYAADGTTVIKNEAWTYQAGTDIVASYNGSDYYDNGKKKSETATNVSAGWKATHDYNEAGQETRYKQWNVAADGTEGNILLDTIFGYYPSGNAKSAVTYDYSGTLVLDIGGKVYDFTGKAKVDILEEYADSAACILQKETWSVYFGDAPKESLILDLSGQEMRVTEFEYDSAGNLTGKNECSYYTSGNLRTLKKYDAANNLITEQEYNDSLPAMVKKETNYEYYAGYVMKSVKEYYNNSLSVQKETIYFEVPNVATLPLRETIYSETGYVNKRTDYDYYASGALHTVNTSDYISALKTNVSYQDNGFGNVGPVIESYSWRLWKGIDSQVKTYGQDLAARPAGADANWQPTEAWLMTVDGYIMEYVNVLENGVYQLSFTALAKDANGQWPIIQVSVDGLYREVRPIQNQADPGTYTVNLDLTTGIHSISLDFVNDTINYVNTTDFANVMISDIQLASVGQDKALPLICTSPEWQAYKSAREAQVLAEAAAKVRVVNNGNPMTNAKVTIEAVAQDFAFGGNYCFTDRFYDGTEAGLKKAIQYNLELLDKFDSLFDQATIGAFWRDINIRVVRNGGGNIDVLYDTSGMDLTLGMLAQKGINDVVGAALIWGNRDAMPTGWLDGLTDSEKEQALKIYVQKMIKEYSNPQKMVQTIDIAQPFDGNGQARWKTVNASIKTWEVLNEPYYVGTFDFLGTKEEAVKKIFDWADEARKYVYNTNYASGQPKNDIKFMLNDAIFLMNGNKPAFDSLKSLVEARDPLDPTKSLVKIDIIGIQAHHLVDNIYIDQTHLGGFDVPYQLDNLKSMLDLYTALAENNGKEVYVTEFEMPSNDHPIVGSPWRGPSWDQAAQAQYIKDFYTLVSSYSAIKGLTYWDFVDQPDDQWCPQSGVLASDVTIVNPNTYEMDIIPKTAYETMRTFINAHQPTPGATISKTADSTGSVDFGTVLPGRYKVTIYDASTGQIKSGYYDFGGQDDLLIDFKDMM